MSRYFFSFYIPSFSLLISISTIVSIVFAITITINLQNVHVALAHPFFVDSTPQPFSNQPSTEKIEIIFSEPIELGYSKISVIGPEGNTVDTGDAQHVTGAGGGVDTSSLAVTLPPNLPEGSYTVSSTVLSAVDGHVVDYSFVFGIGEGAIPASSESSSIGNNIGTRGTEDTLKDIFALEEATARYPGYVGQIIVVGAIFATLWLWRPFRNIPWLLTILSEHRAKIDKNVIRLVLLGTGLVLGSGVAIIFVQSLSIGAGIPEAIATKFGNIWIIRMILASALLIVTVSIYRRIARRSRTARTKETTVILALGISIIFTYSLVSHAAAIKSTAASSILIDFFHGIAASIWIGGLMVLAFVIVPRVIKISDNMMKASIISIMIPRFSTVAVFILGMIIITGPLLLWNLENDISLVAASWYGKILGTKLSLAAIMVAIGAYHQVISQKKAAREVVIASTIENNKTITRRDNDSSNRSGDDNNNNASPSPFGQSTKFGRFDKTLKAEACIGIALLLMVSLMANMTLPSGEFPTYGGQSGEEDGDTSFSSSLALAQTSETKTDYLQARYIDNGNGNTVKVELLIRPFAIGQNQFKVSFTNVSNSVSSPPFSSSSFSSNYTASNSMTENYLTTIENATIKLTQLEEGIGPIEIETTQESAGVFVADAALSLQGTWNIQIEGQTSKPSMPNIVAIFDDVFVKPKISNIISNVTEYKTPDQSLPLYPIYDESRQSIWVGDSMPESGRIWQFNIESKNYTEHLIDNVSLITVSALDPEGNIWYIDPSKSILGKYDVENKENTQFNVPGEGIISGLAMDNNQNLWMSVVQANTIVKFNSTSHTFTSYNIPTPNALPGAITFDSRTNSIWFTEGIGKIAKVNPETGNITEYDPTTALLSSSSSPPLQDNNMLKEPTMAFSDPKTFDIYITEHEGNRITAYNQFLATFEKYPIVNDQGLPFGMAMDKFGNLWFAQHVIDRVAALDPRTGESIEIDIPINGSFIQYLTSDNDGNIWFAAQRASSIGSIVISPGPPTSGVDASTSTKAVATTMETQEQQQQQVEKVGGFAGALISYFGLSFTDILGPLLAGGIILAALFYSKALIDLKRNMAVVTKSK